MKSKTAQATFVIPITIGRSQSDFVARVQRGENYGEQLELFRDVLTPRSRLQVYAMMSLADPKQLDKRVEARIADIARAMGYEPTTSGQIAGHVFQDIEDAGIRLRRKEVDLFFRRPDGWTKDGRRKYKTTTTNLSLLQSFGFYYEDEDGQPIDLDEMPKDQLLPIQTIDGAPLYAIPMIDASGKPVLNPDKTVRRKRANGVHWRFNSELAEMAKNKGTAWVMFQESLKIMLKYVNRPSAFNLIEMTLFWKGNSLIEISHEKLPAHLGIAEDHDKNRMEQAIDSAFQIMMDEGIIDNPVTIRPEKYYKPTQKTKKRRRVGMVYQWRLAKRWRPIKDIPSIQAEGENAIITE